MALAVMAADPVAKSGEGAKLVDAFLIDHGRIHVGEEQPLAPVVTGHQRQIERQGRRIKIPKTGEIIELDRLG